MGLSKKYCQEHFGHLVREYRETHRECAICGIPDYATESQRWPSGLQMAHLMAGSLRKDAPANILMLCSRCHMHQHGSGKRFNGQALPAIDLGVLLAAKRDMGELDCDMLEQLTDYKADWFLSQVSEVPEFYINERSAWRHN